MTCEGESLRHSFQQRTGGLRRCGWFEIQLHHVTDAREECTHTLRYVFGFNAMDRTCNDLPFRPHLDPDATLLLPTRSIGKSYWKLRRMRRPHLQVIAHGQIPS
jgi:hypothetical protein